MKIFTLLSFLVSVLFSNVYYSKVEPFEMRVISSNTSGLVTYTADSKLGKVLSDKTFLKIDSILDTEELKSTKIKIKLLKERIISSETILNNLDLMLEKKKMNYDTIKSLSVKSTLEKDREFYDLMVSENSYLNTKKEISSLKTQLADLSLRKKQLLKRLDDKTFKAKGYMLYSIDVKVGQVVVMGTPVAKVADISHGLLTIYLDIDDVVDAKMKTIYIDGVKSGYKITRLWRVSDSKNVSKYRAQIVIDKPKLFSKVVKIELRDE